MSTSNGPISDGIRRAIEEAIASGKSAYRIAKEAGLSTPQVYRFIHRDPEKRRDLSLKALDEIAKVLELEVREKRSDGTSVGVEIACEPARAIPAIEASPHDPHPPGIDAGEDEPPLPADDDDVTLRLVPLDEPEQDDGIVPIPGGTIAQSSEASTPSSPARRPTRRERLADMEAKLAKIRQDDDEEDHRPARLVRPPVQTPPVRIVDDEDDWGTGFTGESANRESPGTTLKKGWQEKIETAMIHYKITNPGMIALAGKYTKAKGSGTAEDKAKFFNFISHLATQNPQAQDILPMNDLAARYVDIAKRVPDPNNMGRIANRLEPGQLHPAAEDPEAFSAMLQGILRSQGIWNGVWIIRK